MTGHSGSAFSVQADESPAGEAPHGDSGVPSMMRERMSPPAFEALIVEFKSR